MIRIKVRDREENKFSNHLKCLLIPLNLTKATILEFSLLSRLLKFDFEESLALAL